MLRSPEDCAKPQTRATTYCDAHEQVVVCLPVWRATAEFFVLVKHVESILTRRAGVCPPVVQVAPKEPVADIINSGLGFTAYRL